VKICTDGLNLVLNGVPSCRWRLFCLGLLKRNLKTGTNPYGLRHVKWRWNCLGGGNVRGICPGAIVRISYNSVLSSYPPGERGLQRMSAHFSALGVSHEMRYINARCLLTYLHCETKKLHPFSFEHNFGKYCSILIILSLLQTEIKLRQSVP